MPKISDSVFQITINGNLLVITDFFLGEKYVLSNRIYDSTQGYAPVSGAFNPNIQHPPLGSTLGYSIARTSSWGSFTVRFDSPYTYADQLTNDFSKILASNPYKAKLGLSRRKAFIEVSDKEYIGTARFLTNYTDFYYSFIFKKENVIFKSKPGAHWNKTADTASQDSLFFKDNNNNWHSIATRAGYYQPYKYNHYYNDVLSVINGILIARSVGSFYPQEKSYKLGCIPIYIGEDENYAYFYYSIIALPTQMLLRVSKQTGEKSVLNIQIRPDDCIAIASYISQPRDNGNGSYSWYKVVYNSDTKKLEIKRMTFDIANVSVTTEDCDIGAQEISYENNGNPHPFQAFNLEEIELNGKRYLYLFAYNMFTASHENTSDGYSKFKAQYSLVDDAVKVYCWEIGNDNVTLTPVGVRGYPLENVGYIDFVDRDRPELGLMVISQGSVCNISLTGDDSLYRVNWTYSMPISSDLTSSTYWNNVTELEVDVYGNFIVTKNISSRKVYIFGDKILENIGLQFEKDDYSNDQLPINTYVTVNPVNFKGDTVPTRIGLTIRSDNAYWTDNNSKYIEVDVTAPTNVNLTITDRGKVYVTAKAIKEL